MADSNETNGNFNPAILSAGAYDAAVQDYDSSPKQFEETWQRLFRDNPELALSLLDGAKHAIEQGDAPDKAMLHGSMILIHALGKQKEVRELEALLDRPAELAPPIELKRPRRRFLLRTRAAFVAFLALKN